MPIVLKPVGHILLFLLAPQLVPAQWSDGQDRQLVIRGGWLFDGVSDERRRNSGIVIRDGSIVASSAEPRYPAA